MGSWLCEFGAVFLLCEFGAGLWLSEFGADFLRFHEFGAVFWLCEFDYNLLFFQIQFNFFFMTQSLPETVHVRESCR